MKRIFSLLIGLSLVLADTASAKPKEKNKDKEVPPGHARKAAAAEAAVQRSAVSARSSGSRDYLAPAARSSATRTYTAPSVRSTTTRDYVAPSVRSSTIRSSGDRYDSYDRDRRYSDRDGDRYRSSDRYDSGDRYRSSSYRYSRPTIDVYRNWDRGRVYSWNDNRYRWYGGSWVIYDASPRVVYTERSGGSVVASVQAELRRRGYNAGPADGVMGGRTRSAIEDFQEDHGLAPTGRISESLLRALNLA